MKTRQYFYYIYCILASLLVTNACQKNDLLEDQGDLTGEDYPFLVLSSIPDTRALDTITLLSRFWSQNDDIKKIVLSQDGYTTNELELTWGLSYTKDSIEVSKSFQFQHNFDTTFHNLRNLFEFSNQGVELDTFYRTVDNAYVVVKYWQVPAEYQVTNLDNEAVIDSLAEPLLPEIQNNLVDQMDAFDVLQIYPSADSAYFNYVDGKLNGEISDLGKQEIPSHLDKDVLKSFLLSGTQKQEGFITCYAEVENENQKVVKDQSSFDILK